MKFVLISFCTIKLDVICSNRAYVTRDRERSVWFEWSCSIILFVRDNTGAGLLNPLNNSDRRVERVICVVVKWTNHTATRSSGRFPVQALCTSLSTSCPVAIACLYIPGFSNTEKCKTGSL